MNYEVIACAVKKDIHLARYGLAALDPYLLCLDILVERFCMAVGDQPNGGIIIAEKYSISPSRKTIKSSKAKCARVRVVASMDTGWLSYPEKKRGQPPLHSDQPMHVINIKMLNKSRPKCITQLILHR